MEIIINTNTHIHTDNAIYKNLCKKTDYKTTTRITSIVFSSHILSLMSIILDLSTDKRLKQCIALHAKPTSELREVTCYICSHSVTYHPKQVKTPHINPSQASWYSTSYPRWMEGLVNLDGWLHTEMVYTPADSCHPSKEITRPGIEQLR